MTFVALEAETGARRCAVVALRYSDYSEGCVSISRSLVLGLDRQRNQRRHAGRYWMSSVSRGRKPTGRLLRSRSPRGGHDPGLLRDPLATGFLSRPLLMLPTQRWKVWLTSTNGYGLEIGKHCVDRLQYAPAFARLP